MGGLNLTRRASPVVHYKGKDITNEIKPYMTQTEYIENLEGVFDEATIRFDNKDNLFLRSGWAFKKNSALKLGVRTLNWEHELEGSKEKIIGIYNVDKRKFTRKTAIIKAISAPLAAKDQRNSNIYNEITLKELGEKIAKKYNLEFFYKTSETIKLEDVKQEDATDFSFLHKVASEQGVKLKVTNDKLVLFEEMLLTKEKPSMTFDIDNFTEFEINDKSDEIYDAVELTYYNALEDEQEKVIVTKSEIEGGQSKSYKKLFKVKARAKTGDFKKLAKNILARENRKEIEINFKTIGYLGLYTGQVITIENADIFNGNYLITRISYRLPRFEIGVEAYKIKE